MTLQTSTGLIFARFWCRMQYCFTCLLALGTSMKECILHMMCPQSRRWKNWGGERKQWQTLFCPPSIGQKNYLAKEKVCRKWFFFSIWNLCKSEEEEPWLNNTIYKPSKLDKYPCIFMSLPNLLSFKNKHYSKIFH